MNGHFVAGNILCWTKECSVSGDPLNPVSLSLDIVKNSD